MAINKSKAMDAGRRAYERGQYDKALREYLKIVKEDPGDVRVWLKIGDLYTRKEANREAIETYMKVATFYSDKGFLKKSVAVYKQILRVDPRLVEVNLKLAELYRQLGLISDAVQHLELVAAHYQRDGQTQDAVSILRQLVDLDPDNVATRIKLAEVYSKEAMIREAIAEFSTTCDFLRNNGRQEDFIKVAERLLFHDPENLQLCQELAALYLKRNDPRRALAKLQVCFKANQSDTTVLVLLAQAFRRLDQKGKTVSVLKELARVYMEGGRKDEAAEAHERILEYSPADADSLKFLGRQIPSTEVESPVTPVGNRVEPSHYSSDEYIGGQSSIPSTMTTSASSAQQGLTPDSEDIDSAIVDPAEWEGDPANDFSVEDSFVADLELIEEEANYESDTSSIEMQERSDEIVKILRETDVYVKYDLYQKAVDHLRGVFEFDERNIEARERLQEILIRQGRIDEGIRELLILAEHSLTRPAEAKSYLQRILELDSTNGDAIEFATRHHIGLREDDVHDANSEFDSETYTDSVGSGLSIIHERELNFDDLAFDELGMEGDLEDIESPFRLVGDESEIVADSDVDFGHDSMSLVAPTSTIEVDISEDILERGEMDDDYELSPAQDLEFDPAAAAAFDAAPGFYSSSESTNSESTNSKTIEETGVDILGVDIDDLLELDSSELIFEEIEQENEESDVLHSGLVPKSATASSLEEDLDEVDFFLSQGLVNEAKNAIDLLHANYPANPLVLAKENEFVAATNRKPYQGIRDSDGGSLDHDAELDSAMGEILAHDFSSDAPNCSVVLEKPVDDDDSDTHFDLGLAYREMGLLGEAIQAFGMVLNDSGKAVQARMMVGLCHREQDNPSEAIGQFKAGLYESKISNIEKYSLYYEIGLSYEVLEDFEEALYYFEMVEKQDPDFRDVANRLSDLRLALTRPPDASTGQ